MEIGHTPNIEQIISLQHEFFDSGHTKDVGFRCENLKKLSMLIEKYENNIIAAAAADLGKSETETYTSEIFYVQNEIKYFIKNLRKLAKARRYKTPLINMPGSSWVIREPYGTAMVIGPWNYPFGLLFAPIAGAMAAGNCIIAKPSEIAQNTSRLILKIVNDNFPQEYFIAVDGDASIVREILSRKVDYVFFTGSTNTGREIMKLAAERIIPLTMELGGKNPCIVDTEIDLDTAVRRIIWGKFFNSGQTCVAPDFVLVHKSIENEFIEKSVRVLEEFYGNSRPEGLTSGIINEKHFDRLINLLDRGEVISGGLPSRDKLFIPPTIIRGTEFNHPIMQEEIFGPLLPVIAYESLGDVARKLRELPAPLCIYFFSGNKSKQDKIIGMTRSGSVCINGTIHIILSGNLPFGGIGSSGMGTYHGRASFETFTFQRSVLKKSFLFDSKYLYPPYKTPLKTLKKVLKYFY